MKEILTLLLIPTLAGCSYIRDITTPEDKNLLSGAGSIIQDEKKGEEQASNFEEINIDNLLDEYQLNNPAKVAAEQIHNPEEYRYRRNDLQERIISASNQRCSTYIRTIMSSKSQANSIWKNLSLLMSGAAAVVNPTTTSQALSAGSTASLGILGTFNENYFNNIAINLIGAGISKKRDSILININKYQKMNLSDYSVNAAISDAIDYHAACNIIYGMETAAEATKNADISKISTELRASKE